MLFLDNIMKVKKGLNGFVFLVLFTIILVGCSNVKDESIDTKEQTTATGILVVESAPDGAGIYVDSEMVGETPFTLYNLEVGSHGVVVRKEGYADFEKVVEIKPLRTEEIKAVLNQLEAQEEIKEETVEKEQEELTEEGMKETKEKEETLLNAEKIILEKIVLYYDFDNAGFTNARKKGDDTFSKKYKDYVYFTSLTSGKLLVVDKPVNEIKKDDCTSANDAIASIFSGQALCVKTLEGGLFAVGGSWEGPPEELEWIELS